MYPWQIILIIIGSVTVIITKIILSILIFSTAVVKGYTKQAPYFVLIAVLASSIIMTIIIFSLPNRVLDSNIFSEDASESHYREVETNQRGNENKEVHKRQSCKMCSGCGSQIYPGTIKCPTCGKEFS